MLQTLPSAEREAVLQLVSEELVARDGPELSAEVRALKGGSRPSSQRAASPKGSPRAMKAPPKATAPAAKPAKAPAGRGR